MKIYLISGLGADYKVLEKLKFSTSVEPIFIPWLVPSNKENFHDFVKRMADAIDDKEDFYLLGYSFGGIMVQEIHKIKPAKKVVILGSIRSDQEKSKLIKLGGASRLPRLFPVKMFTPKSAALYGFMRKIFDPKNPKVLQYFRMKDPYYLKWSIEKIAEWKFEALPDVIQILADKDIVFPIRNSKPDFVIHNATHLFPATRSKEVSKILETIFI